LVRIYLNTIRRRYGEEYLCCGMIGRDNQERARNKPELMLSESKESMFC